MKIGLQQALDGWNACLALGTLAAHAQSVVTYRCLGMMGGWSVSHDENTRMITEKPQAFFDATLAATKALHAGLRPEQITMAWVEPLANAVGNNRNRLEKQGPTGPGSLFVMSR